MKLSKDKALELVAQLGVEVVEGNGEGDINEVLSQYRQNIVDEVTPDIESQITEQVKSDAYGRAIGTMRSSAATIFGMKTKDFEKMDLKEFMKKGLEEYNSRKGSQANDWEAERNAILEEHEAAIAQLTTEHESALNSERDRFTQREIMSSLMDVTGNIPRKKGDLKEHADLLHYRLNKNYTVKYNDDKLEILTKDGKPVMNGTKRLTVDEIARMELDKVGIVETDTRNVKPADVKSGAAAHVTEMGKQDTPEVLAEGYQELMNALEGAQ